MIMNEIEKKVRDLISRTTGLPQDVPGDANLYLDLGVASVHALQILADLESEFDVSIPDEEFVEASSVAQLVALMQKLTDVPAREPSNV